MATGSYDANGIWNYGEDDNIALFSDLLNLGTESTSDAFTDDRARIATLEAGNLSGLIPVVPTSIVVATGTAAVNTLGVVTYTGATSLSLNGVFNSEYKNYKVILNTDAASIAAVVNFKLRSAGTDYSAANYSRMATTTNAAGATASFASSGGTQWTIGAISNVSNTGAGEFILTNPFTSFRKTLDGSFSGYSGANPASFYGGGYVNTTSTYDGITYYPSAGNITGTIQIFGYND